VSVHGPNGTDHSGPTARVAGRHRVEAGTVDAKRIVVGIDGSHHSLNALRWAAVEAQRDGADLEVVLAYHWRMPGVKYATSHDIQEVATGLATALVEAAVTEARTVAPRLRASGTAVLGDPAP